MWHSLIRNNKKKIWLLILTTVFVYLAWEPGLGPYDPTSSAYAIATDQYVSDNNGSTAFEIGDGDFSVSWAPFGRWVANDKIGYYITYVGIVYSTK